MATYFVNKSGNNTTGSSWANAYTTMAACIAKPVVAGDTIFVGDDHTETQATTYSWTFPGTANTAPYFIACVDHTVASPGFADLRQGNATSAAFTSTGNTTINTVGNFYMYGLYFLLGTGASGTNIGFNTSGGYTQIFEKCYVGCGTTAVGQNIGMCAGGATSRCIDCTFRFGHSNQNMGLRNLRLLRCNIDTVAGVQLTTGLFTVGRGTVEHCDLSNLTSLLALCANPAAVSGTHSLFRRCKLPAVTLMAVNNQYTSDAALTEAVQCDSASALYRNARSMNAGALTTDIAAARVGGATDTGMAVSWKIVTQTMTTWNAYFHSFPIVVWNDNVSTPVSITVEGIADPRDFPTLPNNDQIWIDAEYLGTAGNTVGTMLLGTKANPAGTATTHTASTSDWTAGTAVTRANSTAYTLNTLMKLPSNPGRLFICTQAGTTGASEPGGMNNAGDGLANIVDNTVRWSVLWRFKQTITTPAAPASAGYIYVTAKVGKTSATSGCYIDPLAVLS